MMKGALWAMLGKKGADIKILNLILGQSLEIL